MTKLLTTVLSLSLAGVTPVFADDAHHPDGRTSAATAATPAARSTPQTRVAATPQLLENAKRLQEEALGIARARTPAEQQRLLQQHVQTLREGMMMSNGMMPGGAAWPASAGGAMASTRTMRAGGPGMVGGDRMGPGMMGPGMTGPGMMDGDMMGPGMMGPGMMGPGMMSCPMMGSSMAGGDGPLSAMNLSEEQQRRINAVHDGVRKQHWELMGKIMDERSKLRDLYLADKRDPTAIGAEYQRMFDLRRQMIEASIAAHNQVEEILTPDQRQKVRDAMRRGYGSGMMGG